MHDGIKLFYYICTFVESEEAARRSSDSRAVLWNSKWINFCLRLVLCHFIFVKKCKNAHYSFYISKYFTHLVYFLFIQQKIINIPRRIFTRRLQARVFTVILHLCHNRPENPQNQLNLFIFREVEHH